MSLSPPQASPVSASSTSRPHQKRCRLSVACNQCRKRKVRCDTTLPKCRNCVLRNEPCATSDPRGPDKGPTIRSVAAKGAHVPGVRQPPTPNGQGRRRQYLHEGNPQDLSEAPKNPQGTREVAQTEPSDAEGDLSWVSRAYQESAMENQCESLSGSTPDVVINTDDTTAYKIKFVGGSSLQSFCSFIDLHLTGKGLEPICPHFRHGMHHSEEFVLPLVTSLPLLPPRDKLQVYTEAFFERVWPIFPIVDQAVLQAELGHVLDLQSKYSEAFYAHMTPAGIANLSIIYTVICVGINEVSDRLNETSTGYLTASYGLYAHFVALPYVTSVQALVLLAVALRAQNKDGQAWQVLGQAIRIAHSIGLHKRVHGQSGPRTSSPPLISNVFQSRLWLSCCALERLMQLESGRPSQLSDKDAETPPTDLPPATGPDYFTSWLALSRIMGEIADRFYSRRPTSSLNLFETVQYLDRMLLDWERSLPEGVRPSQGATYSGERETEGYQPHLVSFLSMQFHFAHMTLLRLSLIFPQKSYAYELHRHRAALPSYGRLANTAHICSAAARSTVHDALHLADRGESSVLFSTTPIFLSAMVLALGILRQPSRRVARADLELLSLAAELVDASFSRLVDNGAWPSIGSLLCERVTAFFNTFDTRRAAASRSTLPPQYAERVAEAGPDSAMGGGGGLNNNPIQVSFQCDMPDLGMEPFEDLQFDELWDVMGSDLLLDHNSFHVT